MLMHFLATDKETHGSFAFIESKARQGMEPGRHSHTYEDESFYLLDGRMRFEIGGEKIVAQPGDLVFMPRGIPHKMQLLTETIHALILITPAGFEQYFWQLLEPTQSLEIPPLSLALPNPEEVEQMKKLNEAYGIVSMGT
jgi:quercetin dioxygenase-like cupin family protein